MDTPTPGYLTRREGGQFVLVAINHRAASVTKLPPSMIGRPLDPLYADQPLAMEAAERAFREQRSVVRELKLRRADQPVGRQTLRLTFVPLPHDHVAAFSEDLSEPAEVERVLADVEARNATLITSMMEGVLLLDTRGMILVGNAASATLFGLEEAELLRRRPEDLGTWLIGDRPALPSELPWQLALASGERVSGMKLALHAGERSRWLVASARPIRVAGEITSVGCTLTDVTALEESAAALRESERAYLRSERWLDAALRAGQLGVFEWNVEEGGGAWSPHLDELFGIPNGFGLAGYLERVHPDDRSRITRLAHETLGRLGATFDVQYRIVRPDGECRWVRTTGRHVEQDNQRRLLGVIADVSERYRIQEALTRSERLESLGRLAGGIAHDFNNLLTVILSSLALADADAPAPLREELATARYAADRARELTWQLLAFARRQVVEVANVQLDALIRRTEQMLRRVVGDDIVLETELASAGALVRVDAAQLDQVLVNLVVNARDAMPRGGTIHVTTRTTHVPADEVGALSISPGEYVLLEVRDEGVGIEPALHEKLFEPFFTTKKTGTGLGLASAYGIVRQLRGAISVASEPGRGSTFTVYLPRAEGPPTAPMDSALPPVSSTSHGEQILVVEDDPLVRKVTKRVLERFGYRVTVAADGGAALAVVDAAATPFDLLITDMSMPGMTGAELVALLRERQPALRALVVSGNPPLESGSLKGSAFLQKPYLPNALQSKIRELLSRSE